MARVISPSKTFRAISVATIFQKLAGSGAPRRAPAMSVMMYCATLATPKGRTATTTRSAMPHVTTARPDSQRMRSTGGIFRSALRRSRQGLSAFTLSFKLLLEILPARKMERDDISTFLICSCDASRQPDVGSFGAGGFDGDER